MALPEIPDELLVEILLRLPNPEDLIRASATCVSIRRLVANRAFLRRFRKLHPAPLLGFVDYSGFHPSAPAARAVASAADFSFGFLPAPAFEWSVRDVRDGRVLLDRPRHAGEGLGSVFKDMVVCDPLHRQYLLLPPLPDDLATLIVVALAIEGPCFGEPFLVPSGDDEEETSFRVIWMMLLQTKPLAAVFSFGTGQWRAVPSLTPGFALSTWEVWFVSRHYAHGCFYWVSGTSEKLILLDIQRMEFTMVAHPPCARHSGDDVAIVEAGQGMTVMFVPKPDTGRRIYTVWRNNGGSSTQWQMENEPFSLDPGSLIKGAVGRYLLLYYVGSSSVERGCYTRDVDTFQLERVCGSCPDPSEAYCNFPPSLLSLPTVSSGSRSGASPLPGCRRLAVALRSNNRRGFRLPRPRPLLQQPLRRRPVRNQATGALATSAIPQGTRHAEAQGAGDDVLVPELREADPGGVQGPVVAAPAQALNPLFVIEGTRHPDVQGAGEPEVQEPDPGGLQGPVVAAAARAPNPLFVIEGTRHADAQGVGMMCWCLKYEKLTLEAWKNSLWQRPPKLLTPCSLSKAHPMLILSKERGSMCRCLNYKKLTLKACKDLLSQRLPELRSPCWSSTTMTMLRRVTVGQGEGGAGFGAGAGPAEVAEPGRRGGEGGVRGSEGPEDVVGW